MDKERVLSCFVSEYKLDDIIIVNMECMEKKCLVYIDVELDKVFSDFVDYVGEYMDVVIISM